MSYRRSDKEFTARREDELASGDFLNQLLAQSLPGLGQKWDTHLPVFLTAASIARIFWLDLVYQKALEVPGRVLEFGSQWGASLNVLLMLKMIREPWNAGRKIVSFSTFADGFVSVDAKDGESRLGDYAVSPEWRENLERILETHAARSPIGAKDNFSIIEGDVRETFPKWLKDNPEALISHVHFDMDVYEPTRDMLNLVLRRMPKGAVLVFDELDCPAFPGETQALEEVLGIRNLALRKSQYQPYSAYCIVE
ncbi:MULTISPECIES: class I SAM-dependent methyltransferase [Pseudomonas]|uniref:class I SAM-dependent methyltransferase n=1 Tax=Pseudomonas TaxID=286 RepID=UPI00257FD89E|nr:MULTISPECIES: class I SAM-dependent methyltransferase [Pseudomonas]